jgi:hypothetical protein
VRTLPEVYRRFGEVDAAGMSPLYARIGIALSGSDEALRAIATAPPRRRQPALVLAALHDLALAGRAPALAEAYATGNLDAAPGAAIDALVSTTSEVVAVLARRRIRTIETARCAVLYPAVAEAARRLGAGAVGVIGVGTSAGLDLHVDRVAITYGRGPALGDPASPVQLTPSVVGRRPVPATSVPAVVARVGLDRDPVDVTDPDDTRWLRACLPPDAPGRLAELQAVTAVVTSDPPRLLRGDPVELLTDALARVPSDALPVVTTTWALSCFAPEERRRFLDRLGAAAAGRPVAWVSVEGVGVAPSIPTLGDRPASGHSIIGLALLDGDTPRSEAVGRCWSRGRLLSWLAGA